MTATRAIAGLDQRLQIEQLAVGTLQLGKDEIVLLGRDFFAFEEEVEFVGEHQRQAVNVGIDDAGKAHLKVLGDQALLAPPAAVAADTGDAQAGAQTVSLLSRTSVGNARPLSRRTVAARTS